MSMPGTGGPVAVLSGADSVDACGPTTLGHNQAQTFLDQRRERAALCSGLTLGAGEEIAPQFDGRAFDHTRRRNGDMSA